MRRFFFHNFHSPRTRPQEKYVTTKNGNDSSDLHCPSKQEKNLSTIHSYASFGDDVPPRSGLVEQRVKRKAPQWEVLSGSTCFLFARIPATGIPQHSSKRSRRSDEELTCGQNKSNSEYKVGLTCKNCAYHQGYCIKAYRLSHIQEIPALRPTF